MFAACCNSHCWCTLRKLFTLCIVQMWETTNPFTYLLCSCVPRRCAGWKQCSICTTGGQRLESSFLRLEWQDLLGAKVTWIELNCVAFFLSLHLFLNQLMVTVRAMQRRLHFFFSVSSSMLLPEVELYRQTRGLQFSVSEGDNSFPPTCSITGLIIKCFSLCFHHNSPRHAVLFVACFVKFSRNLMSYCQERSIFF